MEMNENIGYITKEKYVSLSLTKKEKTLKEKKRKNLTNFEFKLQPEIELTFNQ